MERPPIVQFYKTGDEKRTMKKDLESFADAMLKCKTQKEACKTVLEYGTSTLDALWRYYNKDQKAKQACDHASNLIEFDDPDTIY